MKKPYLVLLFLFLLMLTWGCVKKDINPNTLKSPDEKALYDLMVARCRALNAKDMDQFRKIYTKNSPELEWIENVGIPMWESNGMNFNTPSLRKISIIDNDAAASFVLTGNNSSGKSFIYTVEALYLKEGTQWRIESTGYR